MLGPQVRNPRAADDDRMFLYYDHPRGKLRWYVRLGGGDNRRITMKHRYGTKEFDAEVDAAIRKLGGEPRRRRSEPDTMINDDRRFLKADRSRHGQVRYYAQLQDKLRKIRIRSRYGTKEFDAEFERAKAELIGQYGSSGIDLDAPKRKWTPLPGNPNIPPVEGSLRWYWTEYRKGDHWNGNAVLGFAGLSEETKEQRCNLVGKLMLTYGDKPFGSLTRQKLKDYLTALGSASNAGNLMSALKGMTAWMKDHEPAYLCEDRDPTVGLKTGKAKASKESGGFKPWTTSQIAQYKARFALGTEAYLMLMILMECGFRLGDAARFGPDHVRHQRGLTLVDDSGTGLVTEITTEKSGFTTKVNRSLSQELFEAINASEIGDEVFVGKRVKGKIVPMGKESWGAKFKKYAVMAGVNVRGQRCHGMRKASAIEAAFAGATTTELQRMYGWEDEKMPGLYTKLADGETLAVHGSEKVAAYRERLKNMRKNRGVTNPTSVGNKWQKLLQNQG